MDQNNNNEENVDVEVEIELPYTMPLHKPIEILNRATGKAAKTIDSLVFKNDLTAKMVGHIRVSKDGTMSMADFYPIISQMTGELPQTIDKLSFADVQAGIEVVSHFLNDGPNTGDSQ